MLMMLMMLMGVINTLGLSVAQMIGIFPAVEWETNDKVTRTALTVKSIHGVIMVSDWMVTGLT